MNKNPWLEIHNGAAFFVPCLDPRTVIPEGMRLAVLAGVFDVYSVTGMLDKQFGVLFGRGHPPKHLRGCVNEK